MGLPPRCADFLEFLGDVTLSIWRLILGRAGMRMQDFIEAMYECGVRALPIISITSLLFGLILAFVGAVQLTQFGAQIYVAGLVGIGMLRVMGAVMVGVVMSGRVGAAYAAMIGTMQVNEEVDALTTLGISPIDFLVLPRMLALMLMVPLLTVYADLMGILGGYVVGVSMLGLSSAEYLNATMQMVSFVHGLIVRHHHRPGGLLSGHPLRPQRPGRGPGHHHGRGPVHRGHHHRHGRHHHHLQRTGHLT